MKRVLDQLQQAAQKKPNLRRVDIVKVLSEVCFQCADRHPAPSVELPDQAVWVTMDKERLASVFTHLIRNAQDATPVSGRVAISIEQFDDSIVIRVSDTGCGMTPEFVRGRLFRPFDSTKGVQGMGIGAYQARDIVRSGGGELDVTSEPGVGTSFQIRLPTAPTSLVQEPAA